MAKINRVFFALERIRWRFMAADELAELRERVVRLEAKSEELNKRSDSVSKYLP
jgi:hypothetical protein